MTPEHPADALAQLTYRFFYLLDEHRFADLLAMMKPDAIWHRQGKHLRGRREILTELEGRPSTQRIRHVITNSFVETESKDSATVKAYMVAYRFDDGTPRQPPITIDGPLRMVLLTTRFARESDGSWLISEQTAVPEFEFRGASL